MKVLVTGGTGFVGSNLVSELRKRNYEIVITGHDTEQMPPNFKGKYLQPSLVGIDWDAIGNIDILFHQAAINDTTLLDKDEMNLSNVRATKKLFDYVIKSGCKKIVYASSTAVYGNLPAPYHENMKLQPLNPYAESKVALEKLAKQFAKDNPDITVVGLRYCNVYGPREGHKGKRSSMIYQLARQMIEKNPLLFKYGEQKRDYIYVIDVVRANLLAAEAGESCIVNCGFGSATTFNNLFSILNKKLGVNREIEYIDNPYEDRYQNYTECDMTLANEKLGFVPEYDIHKGIEDYYKSGFLI